MLRAVLDTNVLVAALRSQTGAAGEVVRELRRGSFVAVVSNNLSFEHQDVLVRPGMVPGLPAWAIEKWLDAYAALVEFFEVDFLWRPLLPDPDDERVLDAAFAGHASYIVTRNLRDFRGAETLGIKAVTPDEFLRILRQP